MTRTTEQWEALLDGTTPTPWEPRQRDLEDWEDMSGDEIHVVVKEDGESLGFVPVAVGEQEEYAVGDAHLIAAAPDAVAEVIRLRNGLQDLADWHDIKAMKARDFPWPQGQHAARHRGKAEAHETARNKIRAILNGDPDEH